MAEYKLSYTASQINDRLGKVTTLSEDVGSLQENVQVISDDVQVKAEIVTLSTEEYEALEANESTNANTLYMLTDAEDDTSVLYTEQTLTDEQKAQARENIGAVQSDWNQTDETAPDYIKNRTHWAEAPVTTTTVILPERTCEGFADGYWDTADIFMFGFKPDTEYTVTLDGVEYTVMTERYLNFTVCGNPAILMIEENAEDNGQPFGFAYDDTNFVTILMSNDLEAASHTVGIAQTVTTQEIHKLDDKYVNAEWLPQKTMIPTVGVVETTMTVKDTGEDRLPSESYDMNALMSAEYCDVLWNGTTYKCVPQETVGMTLIGNISIFDSTTPDSGEPFLFGCGDLVGGVAPMVPAETEATFSITCYNSAIVSTIPEEYLPEKLQFGNEYEAEVQKEAITWDGDTTGRATLESLDWNFLYHVSNAVPTLEDLIKGGVLEVRQQGMPLIMSFTSQDIENLEGVIFFISERVCEITDLAASMFGVPAGIYFYNDGTQYVSSFTINNYTFVEKETKIKTIDPKYLPEALRFGESESSDTLSWTATSLEELDQSLVVNNIFYPIWTSPITFNDISKGITLKIPELNINDTIAQNACQQLNQDICLCGEILFIVAKNGASWINGNGVKFTFPKAGLYMALDLIFYDFTCTINGYSFATIKKIDPKYLPDNIGGGSGLPEVSAEDESAFLRVVNGEWKAVVLPSVEEGEF